MVTTPAMMPAIPQATATDSVFLPPFSNASKIIGISLALGLLMT